VFQGGGFLAEGGEEGVVLSRHRMLERERRRGGKEGRTLRARRRLTC